MSHAVVCVCSCVKSLCIRCIKSGVKGAAHCLVLGFSLAHWFVLLHDASGFPFYVQYKEDNKYTCMTGISSRSCDKQTTVPSPIASVYHFTFSIHDPIAYTFAVSVLEVPGALQESWAVIGDRAVRLVPDYFKMIASDDARPGSADRLGSRCAAALSTPVW